MLLESVTYVHVSIPPLLSHSFILRPFILLFWLFASFLMFSSVLFRDKRKEGKRRRTGKGVSVIRRNAGKGSDLRYDKDGETFSCLSLLWNICTLTHTILKTSHEKMCSKAKAGKNSSCLCVLGRCSVVNFWVVF